MNLVLNQVVVFMTSKKNKSKTVYELFVPVMPKPASRPRVSKYGTYHTKSYTDFRRETWHFLKTLQATYKASSKHQFHIDMEFICYKPKKPSNPYPRYDIDNLVKAIMDSITYAQLFYKDDIQVISIEANKRYQEEGEDYGTKVIITQL